MREIAIEVKDLFKIYKLYDKPSDRLKDSLGLSRKKCYREYFALKNINLEVLRGETVGIIGTNGAGKSTILKIITGVLSATSGSVNINGRISALLELGAGFNMEYTGLENVYLNGAMIGFSREEIDAKLNDILEFADIGDFIHQPVKTYSSGMFVRLAFAVAISIDPEILIVDEALSVGDVFFQAKCFRKFEEFKKKGKTILFVSHDLSSVNKYCDRVFLLNHGELIREGSPKDMIDVYKKILVNQYSEDEEPLKGGSEDGNLSAEQKESGIKTVFGKPFPLKDSMYQNPNVVNYGNQVAEIVDYAILDEKKTITNSVESGTEVTVYLQARFSRTVKNPVLAFTFKDIHGVELVGTNTMFEGIDTGIVQAGEYRAAVFTQKLSLQKGDYLLSLGCTGFEDGEFQVYHRLYDVCALTVYTDENFVGKWNLHSKVNYL